MSAPGKESQGEDYLGPPKEAENMPVLKNIPEV